MCRVDSNPHSHVQTCVWALMRVRHVAYGCRMTPWMIESITPTTGVVVALATSHRVLYTTLVHCHPFLPCTCPESVSCWKFAPVQGSGFVVQKVAGLGWVNNTCFTAQSTAIIVDVSWKVPHVCDGETHMPHPTVLSIHCVCPLLRLCPSSSQWCP